MDFTNHQLISMLNSFAQVYHKVQIEVNQGKSMKMYVMALQDRLDVFFKPNLIPHCLIQMLSVSV